MIYLAMKNDAPTLKEAALLLQVVATIASNEVDKDTKKESQNMSTNDCVDYSMSTENLLKLSPLNHRVRTVSISSPASSVSRPLMLPPPLPHSIQQVLLAESTVPPLRPVSPPPQGNSARLPALCTVGQLSLRHCKHTAPEPAQNQESSPKRKSKYVGTHTPHKVRGVLKRKFSWKNYPEVSLYKVVGGMPVSSCDLTEQSFLPSFPSCYPRHACLSSKGSSLTSAMNTCATHRRTTIRLLRRTSTTG